MSYEFRSVDQSGLPQLNQLFSEAFDSELPNHLQWKYFENPAGNAILAGAFYNGKMVGSGAMVPEVVSVFNAESTVYKCTDLMTHPGHQRKGISKKINGLLRETTEATGTPFAYTLCSKVSTKSFVRKGWFFVGEILNFFKPRPQIQLKGLLSKKSEKRINHCSLLEFSEMELNVNDGVAGIRLKHDKMYFKWRGGNPDFDYSAVYIEDGDSDIIGYLIYSVSVNNFLNILDIRIKNGNQNDCDELLQFAENVAINENRKAVLMPCTSNSRLYHIAKRNHYLRNPLKFGPLKTILDLNVLEFSQNENGLADIGNWDVCGLNYDDI